MQEGGIADSGISKEPVTGNEIPPGSMASEVRDDIPTQLSECRPYSLRYPHPTESRD